jgi:succinylglutamate desuccinylase
MYPLSNSFYFQPLLLFNKIMNRLIGRYSGEKHGALVIVLGATHGNERMGVRAINQLLTMLEDEPDKNPAFEFRGRLVGLVGNIQAFERKVRYVKKDLNRLFSKDYIASIQSNANNEILFEDLELLELLQAIEHELADYPTNRLVVFDLHTTSASGGIFTIVSEDAESNRIATELYAPVVKGLVKGLGGTTLHYFNTETMGINTVSVSFEAGQHDDPLSIRRMIAWLVDGLRAIDCVSPDDVESRHDDLLRHESLHLPKVVELFYAHKIEPHDRFKMRPGYLNFQPIQKGEVLADDINGEITAIDSGLILMPLYQAQGRDGFFLVKPVG